MHIAFKKGCTNSAERNELANVICCNVEEMASTASRLAALSDHNQAQNANKGGKTVMSCPSSLQYFCLGVRDRPIWHQCSEHAGAGVAMGFCLALLIAGQQYGIGGADF